MPVHPIVEEYISHEEDYPRNAFIIQEGKFGEWIYVLLKGQAKIYKNLPDGKGKMPIGTVSEGEIFGELNFLLKENAPRSASVVAETEVTVGLMDAERLWKDMESISPRLRRLIASLIRRLQQTTEKAVSF